MKFKKIIDVLNTLILRGGGAGVAVLFTMMVARYLPTEEASSFFLLFNISTIAAVCFRWGLDEVIVRRVAKIDKNDERILSRDLIFISYRRVFLWLTVSFLALGFYKYFLNDFFTITPIGLFLSIISASFLALSACSARIVQGKGRTNLATFLLNIIMPSLLLLGLFFLVVFKEPTTLDLMVSYVIFSFLIFVFSVVIIYGNPIKYLCGQHFKNLKKDRAAANKLGMVVFSQQVLIWTAFLVIPSAYGGETYKAFVVIQKISTLISLVMLAINFTFSRNLALMYASGDFSTVRKLARYSVVFIIVFGMVISSFFVIFNKIIFHYVQLDSDFINLLFVLLFGQIFFSISALFSVILSMAHDDVFLFKSQSFVNFIGSCLFCIFCFLFSIEIVSFIFVVCYIFLSFLLGCRVFSITKAIAEEGYSG